MSLKRNLSHFIGMKKKNDRISRTAILQHIPNANM